MKEQTDRVVTMLSPYCGGPVVVMRGVCEFYDQQTNQTYDIESECYMCVNTLQEFSVDWQDQEWVDNVYSARRRYKLTQLGI